MKLRSGSYGWLWSEAGPESQNWATTTGDAWVLVQAESIATAQVVLLGSAPGPNRWTRTSTGFGVWCWGPR